MLLQRRSLDHRPHAHVQALGRIAHLDGLRPLDDLRQQRVVDVRDDDRARAGRALLALIAERGGHDAGCGGIQVGGLIHQDGVLAAHLQDRALEPDLAGLHLGRALEDAQPDLLAAGEGDEACHRVVHQRIADRAAGPGQEVEHAWRQMQLLVEQVARPRGRSPA